MESERVTKRMGTWLLVLGALPLAGCWDDPMPTGDAGASATAMDTATSSSTVAGGDSLILSGAPPTEATSGVDYYFQPLVQAGPSNISFSISGKPAWMNFDSNSGLLSGRPTDAQVGVSGDILITASSNAGSGSIGPFTIRVTTPAAVSAGAGNKAPTISGTPATSVVVGSNYDFLPAANDSDGGPLVFSIVNGPSWASFSTSTGRLTGIPRTGSEGTYANILIRVSDGYTTVALPVFNISVQTATVSIANIAPAIAGSPALTAVSGVPYTFTPTAADANNDSLSYTVQNLPAWAKFNTSTGQISGTPTGANLGSYANIVVSVSDGRASTTLPAFKIDVMATQGNGSATMTWNPPLQNADGSALTDLAGYIIYYGKDANNLIYSQRIANGAQVTFQAGGLANGLWNFSIRSVNGAGVESNPVAVSTSI